MPHAKVRYAQRAGIIKDASEYTEAIWKKDKALFRRALLTDPLTCSISDIDAIMEELLKFEKDAIKIELK